MSRLVRSARVAAVLVGMVMIASGCGSSTGGTAPSTTGPASTAGPTSDPPGEILPGTAIVEGLPRIDLLGPGSSNAGAYPLFMWAPFPAAASYQLVLADSSGPIWAWTGTETQIRLGAVSEEPPAGYGGPSLDAPGCWSVVARDTEGHVMAASDMVPVSPGNDAPPVCSPGG